MKLTKIFASAFMMMAVATASFAQTADEIVAKHFEAIGGVEKWKAVKATEMNMKTSVQGMDVEIKSTVALDKGLKSVVSVMGQEIVTGIDGDTGWNIRPAMMGGTGEPEDMPGSLVKESKKQMVIGGGLLNYKENGSKVELVGEEKLDGADVYNLKLTDKSGDVTNYYLSASTYYILKSAGKIKMQGQEIDNEVSYSNFKQVDGLTFPFTREQPNPQMGGTMTVETESIKLNPTLDADFFKKPVKK
jgi:hypothetical protein